MPDFRRIIFIAWCLTGCCCRRRRKPAQARPGQGRPNPTPAAQPEPIQIQEPDDESSSSSSPSSFIYYQYLGAHQSAPGELGDGDDSAEVERRDGFGLWVPLPRTAERQADSHR
ncbi:hypothetical protein F66182_7605 [Fusarium sp. NRRL 66182]|nr:hypothetical protein F66182_7605 [Fusarium sp. NRRL 66182]